MFLSLSSVRDADKAKHHASDSPLFPYRNVKSLCCGQGVGVETVMAGHSCCL